MAAYMGHFLCFPQYGPPTEDEVRNNYNNHGEAILVEWKPVRTVKEGDRVSFRYGADLPQTQFRVEREITLAAGESVFHVEESIENLASFDRPVNWVQHVTFGPPFVEAGRNYLDAPVVQAELQGSPGGVSWPEAVLASGERADLRQFEPKAHSGRYHALLLDRSRPWSYFTAYHTGYPVLIGHLFAGAENPWIGDWQENQRVTQVPWNGKVVARGVDWGTTPYAEGLRKSVERSQLFGVPAYRWIGGRQRVTQRYMIFLAEAPAGYRGTTDVRREEGFVRITEHGTGRVIELPCAGR
jgi:hypothetical protein